MKRIASLILAILATIPTLAQSPVGTLSVVPKVGATLSNITKESMGFVPSPSGGEYVADSKTRLGLMAGADLQLQATPVVAVSLGAYYQQMGSRFDDTDLSGATAGTYTAFQRCRTNLHFAAFPLMAHVYVARNLSLAAGMQFSVLLDNNLRYEETQVTIGRDGSYTYSGTLDETSIENTYLRKTDISIPIGIAYEYENVVVDARYNIGVSKAYKSPLDNGNRHRAFVISAGYKFDVARL